jgi:hypothetical protein
MNSNPVLQKKKKQKTKSLPSKCAGGCKEDMWRAGIIDV